MIERLRLVGCNDIADLMECDPAELERRATKHDAELWDTVPISVEESMEKLGEE